MSEVIWAPWRIDYILGPKGGGCVFCEYASHDVSMLREDLVLVMQAHAFVCMNRYPYASGHLLIVPRRHVSGLGELSTEEYDATMRLLRDAVACVEVAMRPGGVNIGVNVGQAAGAGIADHLHAHVVPRWVGDANFMPVVADTRVMPEYLDKTWQRLRAAFERVEGAKG
jgi:ATP adenylyltransferase